MYIYYYCILALMLLLNKNIAINNRITIILDPIALE